MKLIAKRVIEYTYEPRLKYYPNAVTMDEIVAIDLAAAKEDPELFFFDAQKDETTVTVLEK